MFDNLFKTATMVSVSRPTDTSLPPRTMSAGSDCIHACSLAYEPYTIVRCVHDQKSANMYSGK